MQKHPKRVSNMSRVTISLSEGRHRALKTAAARRGKTIGQLVEESLEAYGIKPESDVMAILERVRARATLSEEEAMELAVQETRAARRESR